jgi:arylsulfatase A-like enzyme
MPPPLPQPLDAPRAPGASYRNVLGALLIAATGTVLEAAWAGAHSLATPSPATGVALASSPGAGLLQAVARADTAALTRTDAPALIVMITVDQLRADYLERFGPQFTGGFARLLKGGAVFTEAHHDHAITETAPGHATLLSGRFPRSTGIMLNRVGVEDAAAPLVDGGYGPGASPARFRGTTLADWLRGRDRGARVLSVSMKDRGAILPIGRMKTDVYWYSPDGRWVTSSYYAKTLPTWVKSYNNRHLPHGYAGRSWTLLLPEGAYGEPDSVPVENGGINVTFPHPLPADPGDAASLVRLTPFMDELTLGFALNALVARELGATRSATRTDLLAISLSVTDVIGHGYGPDSREIHDAILRLDRSLGVFLDSLYRLRDSTTVTIALSADHGVGPIPELAAARQPPPNPLPKRGVSLYGLLAESRARMAAARVDSSAIDVDEQILLLNRAAFRGSSLDPDTVVEGFARRARAIAGVARVDRLRAMFADSASDPLARRWSHQFPPGTNIELVVTLTPFSTWGGNVASHGSPHAYDSGVPLILFGAGVKPGRHRGPTRTVDLAPTLAALAGVSPSERTDGTVLRDALASAPRPPATPP